MISHENPNAESVSSLRKDPQTKPSNVVELSHFESQSSAEAPFHTDSHVPRFQNVQILAITSDPIRATRTVGKSARLRIYHFIPRCVDAEIEKKTCSGRDPVRVGPLR